MIWRSPVVPEDVMGDAVRLAACTIAVQPHCALSVEVHRYFVLVQSCEHRGQLLPAVEIFGGLRTRAIHVDGEVRVLREERLLSVCVATISAVRVRVQQLANRQPVGGLCG